jgi:hypothetical protein
MNERIPDLDEPKVKVAEVVAVVQVAKETSQSLASRRMFVVPLDTN